MHHPERIDLEKGLHRELARLSASTFGDRKQGWHGKSLGVGVLRNSKAFWLRIKARRKTTVLDRLWNGEREAAVFDLVVRKPSMIESLDWIEDDIEWRSELMSIATDPVASNTPELQTAPARGSCGTRP